MDSQLKYIIKKFFDEFVLNLVILILLYKIFIDIEPSFESLHVVTKGILLFGSLEAVYGFADIIEKVFRRVSIGTDKRK